MGDFGDADHARLRSDYHLPAELLGAFDDLLQAVDGGAEAGDQEALLGAVEDILEARADGALGLGVAGAVGVGRVGHEQQDAALAVVGEGMEVEKLVVGGGGIHLEIAGVNRPPLSGR